MCIVTYGSQHKRPRLHAFDTNQQAFRSSQSYEDYYGSSASTCGKKRIRKERTPDVLTPASIIQPSCTEVLNLPLTPPRRIPFQYLYFQEVVTNLCIGNLCGAITLAWLNPWETVDSLLKGNTTGKVRPGLTAHFMKYAKYVIEKANLSPEVVKTALLYVYRLRKTCAEPVYGEPSSEARIFIVALMTANKYVEDVSYTLPAWGRMSAISSDELKIMEMEFLKKLDFNLHVTSENWTEFGTFMSDVVNPVVDKLNLSS